MTITFEIAHNISSSKGWGRYKATTPQGVKVVESSTGNEWVSAPHSGETEPGTEILATLQTMERVGKGGRSRESVNADSYRLIAREGGRAELGYWNGLQVVVTGAEVIG